MDKHLQTATINSSEFAIITSTISYVVLIDFFVRSIGSWFVNEALYSHIFCNYLNACLYCSDQNFTFGLTLV